MKLLSELKKAKPIDYNPFYARLLAAVAAAQLIISFNEKESWIELLALPYYYTALVSNTVMASLIIEVINWVTRRLDRKSPWVFFPMKRTLLQVGLGIGMPILLSILLAILYFWRYDTQLNDTVFFSEYFLIIVLMVILANAYYFIHFGFWGIRLMLNLNKKAKIIRKIDLVPDIKVKWPTTDIAMIQIENDGYIVTTSKGERLNWPDTLETTIDNLPYEDYFLVNRSTIVNIKNIISASVSSSRRFALILKVPAGMEVDVSQRYAKGSKDWLELNSVEIRKD